MGFFVLIGNDEETATFMVDGATDAIAGLKDFDIPWALTIFEDEVVA